MSQHFLSLVIHATRPENAIAYGKAVGFWRPVQDAAEPENVGTVVDLGIQKADNHSMNRERPIVFVGS